MTGSTPRGRLVALDTHFLDWIHAAVLVTDLRGFVVFANPYCEVVYGVSPDELVGTDAALLSQEPLPPELVTELSETLFAGRSWEGEFRIVRPDGRSVEVHAINAPVFDENGTDISGVVSLAFDVTAQRLSQDEVRRVLAIGDSLRDIGQTVLAELDVDRLMQTVIDAARRMTHASMGVFLHSQADTLETFVVGAVSGRAREDSTGAVLPVDVPVLSAALTSDTSTRFDDVTATPSFADALDAVMPSHSPPLQSCVVVPVRSRAPGASVGAAIVAHAEPDRFSETDERLLRQVAAQTGIVLDIARLFRAAEAEIEARGRAESVQRFFAEATTVLSSSLDYPHSFERIARLCVPFVADMCLVDVAEEHGLHRVATVHGDPSKHALVLEVEKRYPPDPYGQHPAASVVRGGEAEVEGSISDEDLRGITHDDRHFEILRELGVSSYMCVPLAARGRTLGALTLVSSGSGRRFGAADLELAEEFGRRAGIALNNPRLYSERDHVARALQASLLPPSLPEIPGVRVSARYRAAGEGNEVGGDFYHLFQVDANAWWIVIGDVSGKGPEAAGIAGLARHTLRTVAVQERSPSRLLAALHDTLLREGRGEFCTVCCALLEPSADGMVVSVGSGGHPAPIVRRADGRIEAAACSGSLLGMPVQVEFHEEQMVLAGGDTLVFYTDGVTEAHERNEELFGEERLMRVITSAVDDVDRIADDILAAVSEYGPAEPRDDLAVVVVQIQP